MLTASEKMIEVHPLIMTRARTCAEAADRFVSVGNFRLAATALEDAATACNLLRTTAEAYPPAGHELLTGNGPVALACRQAHEVFTRFSLRAAACWMGLASREVASHERRSCWTRAEVQFRNVGNLADAVTCAVRAGQLKPREVLGRLAKMAHHNLGEKSFVWLCAASLGGLE